MRAVTVAAFGPAAALAPGERDAPRPGPGAVLVDIHASDVNFPDRLMIEGKYQSSPPFPFSPGMAGAGRVAALGTGVTGFAIGQKLLVLPDHGTYAEQAVAPAHACYPMPEAMPFATAAAFGLCYQTAWFALIDRGMFAQGDHVLVYGATGGVGMAAVQLAKALGAASVTAVVRGEEAAAFAREIGADSVIDAALAEDQARFTSAVMEATGGHGADVVIDPVGGRLNAVTPRAMAWRGRLVIVGFASGEIPAIRAGYLLVRNISASGLQWTDYRDREPARAQAAQQEMFALWSAGRLDPHIAHRWPLGDFAQALAGFGGGRLRGKQVLVVRDEETE